MFPREHQAQGASDLYCILNLTPNFIPQNCPDTYWFPKGGFPYCRADLSNQLEYGARLADGLQYTSKLVDYKFTNANPDPNPDGLKKLSQTERCNPVDGVDGEFVGYYANSEPGNVQIYFCRIPTKSPTSAPTKSPTSKPTAFPTVAPSRFPTIEDGYNDLEHVYANCTETDWFPEGDYPNCKVHLVNLTYLRDEDKTNASNIEEHGYAVRHSNNVWFPRSTWANMCESFDGEPEDREIGYAAACDFKTTKIFTECVQTAFFLNGVYPMCKNNLGIEPWTGEVLSLSEQYHKCHILGGKWLSSSSICSFIDQTLSPTRSPTTLAPSPESPEVSEHTLPILIVFGSLLGVIVVGVIVFKCTQKHTEVGLAKPKGQAYTAVQFQFE